MACSDRINISCPPSPLVKSVIVVVPPVKNILYPATDGVALLASVPMSRRPPPSAYRNKALIAFANKRKFPIQHYAARFAAKEAVYKAFGDRISLSWKDMTILNDKNGKPYCRLNDAQFKNKILISISHSKNYAVANAIITP